MLLLAYIQPIFFNILDGRKQVQDAPWSLGRWGMPINIIAVTLSVMGILFFLFPLTLPATIISMSKSPLCVLIRQLY